MIKPRVGMRVASLRQNPCVPAGATGTITHVNENGYTFSVKMDNGSDLYERSSRLWEELAPKPGSFIAGGPNDVFDVVNKPKHYQVIGNTEAKSLIAVMLEQYVKDKPDATPYQIYCAGNAFKYRLRAGAKDNVEQEIGKANKYKEMHDA